MHNRQPFSIKIFSPNGDPDGLRVIERSNWVGNALVFPRSLMPQVKRRREFVENGVYILMGPGHDGRGQRLLIGEADPIAPKLESHFAEEDFWTQAVLFTSSGASMLSKAQLQFLESRLIELALSVKRVNLQNRVQPATPRLGESDRAEMEVFLSNMRQILPILGIDAFELPPRQQRRWSHRLTINQADITAYGSETSQGFVVFRSSKCVDQTSSSLYEQSRSVYDLRESLLDKGVLFRRDGVLHFTQDYSFECPTTAASVVLGEPVNGRAVWSAPDGRSLREVEESLAGAPVNVPEEESTPQHDNDSVSA